MESTKQTASISSKFFSTILHRTNFHLSSKVDFAGWAICISSAFFFDMSELVSTARLTRNIPTDIGV